MAERISEFIRGLESTTVSFALSGLGHWQFPPTAYAVGYVLPPLRGVV